MSKAEEAAYKAYSYNGDYRGQGDSNSKIREAYINGYHQAEKDLELSWEDIPKLFSISEQLKTSWWFKDNEQTKLIGTQTFWEEVLKLFKEKKEKEV
jgi:hypothetical protein